MEKAREEYLRRLFREAASPEDLYVWAMGQLDNASSCRHMWAEGADHYEKQWKQSEERLAALEEALALETRVSLDYQKQRDEALTELAAARAENEHLRSLLHECLDLFYGARYDAQEIYHFQDRIKSALGMDE
jgi:hypothetical protein